MRVALTGTPCVGKTTAADTMRKQGTVVVDLKAWAIETGAVSGRDEDGTLVIDTDSLDVAVLPPHCVIEGHMAHHLPVDAIWVVRCDPRALRPRLEARGYSSAKVTENLEAEAMDLILQESLATGIPVVQRDATHRTAAELLSSFAEVSTDTLKGPDLEPVDWSDRLMEGL